MVDADGVEIAYCHACGSAMDVTEVAPFSNVECSACGKQTRVKREFGPYTLVRRQGVGGMSLVFVAHDNTLQRELALKILNQDQSRSEKRIAQFEEEARITAAISHPNVVRVYTTGRSFGRFYIAMELVGGGHLEQRIHERGRIPEAEVLSFAIEVASGLRAAHAAGLIHRDIKPGNILFDADGHAKIVDFGLALVTKGGTATADEIWATPYYVPPETIEGAPEDFRSDIYALGATLYHALAGVPSCAEDSMSGAVLREAKKRVAPIEQVAPWLSGETCAVVNRAMAYTPAERFSSYDELINALNAALAHGENNQPVHSVVRAKRRASGTHPAVWGALVAGAAVLVAGGVWLLGRGQKPAKINPQTTTVPVVVASGSGSGGSTVSAAKVAELYDSASKALANGQFDEAGELFSALMEKPGVIEPTGSWSGFQAVLAGYLAGDSGKARRAAGQLLQHLKGLSKPPEVAATFSETARLVQQVPVVSKMPSGAGAAGQLARFACALKNWEQGALELAAQDMREFAEAPLGSDDQWVAVYQRYARKYLADYERLTKAQPKAAPQTAEECKRLVDTATAVMATLETRGRARFNVRSWVQLAGQQQRLLERQGTGLPAGWEEPEEFAKVLAAVQPLLKAGNFAEAVDGLKKAQLVAGDEPARKGWLYLAQGAGEFLKALEKGCAERVIEVPMVTQDGRRFAGTVGSAPGAARFVEGGEQISIAWTQLTPDSLAGLHSVLIRSETNEAEKVHRHEAAIAYLWLAGDKAKAGVAASRIDNAEFRARWSEAMKAVGGAE